MNRDQKKQRNRKLNIATIVITAVLAVCLTVTAFLIPLRPERSDTEKRRLAEFPSFHFNTLFSGEYFSDISAWFSDTVPFRDALVSANAKIQHLLGTSTILSGFNEGVKGDEIPEYTPADPQATAAPAQTEQPPQTAAPETTLPPETTAPPETTLPPATEEPESVNEADIQKLSSILIYGNAGYEYYNFVQSAADNYVATINRCADALAGRAAVYSMIIPTSMDIVLPAAVRKSVSVSDQKQAIGYMESGMNANVRRISVFDTLAAHKDEYIYFRTDHHWTALGAYYAYREFCAVKGVAPIELGQCTKQSFDNFLGSFYNDSGMSPALGGTPDVVDAYTPPENAKLTVNESSGGTYVGNVIYNATTSRPAYKYSAFIYGDNPFSVIENQDRTDSSSCLLVKDSFGNAFAPFLLHHYKYVYIMDPRHYHGTVRDLVAQYGISDVIFTNNISMTRDKNQVQLVSDHI